MNDDYTVGSTLVTTAEDIYKENLLDHYQNPRNKKPLEICSFSGQEVNMLCGDNITFFVKVEHNVVVALSFTGQGCAISQAAASMLTEYFKGKNIEEVERADKKTVLSLLGIPISPARMRCALLGLVALQKGWREFHA